MDGRDAGGGTSGGAPPPGSRRDHLRRLAVARPSAAADHPWLPAAVATVLGELRPLAPTWSILHTDPAPEAFRHDERTGTAGLIEWAGAQTGPVLYDVASAVMYLGGPARAETFLTVHIDLGPLPPDELALLDSHRRLRWLVQAAYFTQRLTEEDLTGLADGAGNVKGLADARAGLKGLGIDTG